MKQAERSNPSGPAPVTTRLALSDLTGSVNSWNPESMDPDARFVYIDIASIDRELKAISTTTRLRAADAPSRARQIVAPGDVLVSTVRPNLNAVARVPEEMDTAVASTGFCVLRADLSRLDSGYLFHWVRSPRFVAQMTRLATGASYPAVTDAIVKQSRLPVPPLPEQRRIAALLDKADAIRRKRQQAIRLADNLLRSAFLDMFGDPVTNPKGWPVVSLDEVSVIQGGLQVTATRQRLPLAIPYLRVANVYRGRLQLDEVKTLRITEDELVRAALAAGDILVVEGHGNREEIGRSAVWDGSIAPCVHQNHLIRVRCARDKAEPSYISAFINSAGGRQQLFRSGKTTSGLNTISTSNVRAVRVALPPIDVQQKYVSFARQVVSTAQGLSAHLLASGRLFHSLVQRAFGGQL